MMKNFRSYDPIWMGILTGLAGLILWYFSSLAVDKAIVPTSSDKIWPFISAGIGAFSGSYFAYLFRKHEETQAKLNKRKSALDACLFTLRRQYNAMFQMKKLFDAHPSDLDKALSMQAMIFPQYKDARVDFESLNFLTDLNEIQHLLHLTIEQERFEQSIASMELRNNFHIEKLQPALENLGINEVLMPVDEIERLLGPLIFNFALNSALTTYEALTKNLESNYDIHKKTWEIAHTIFPDKAFLAPSDIHKKIQ